MGPYQEESVRRFWFERLVRYATEGSSPFLEDILVVETDLLTDDNIVDSGQIQDLEEELRGTFSHRGDIRFVPPGHYS